MIRADVVRAVAACASVPQCYSLAAHTEPVYLPPHFTHVGESKLMRKTLAALALCWISLAVLAAEPPHDEVALNADAPKLEGHPVTSVVVTQCNLVVAVYVTMADGRLLRFGSSSKMAADDLLAMAYTADRSERVEVGCTEVEGARYETHAPI